MASTMREVLEVRVYGCRYVRHREAVMVAERLGCQACILFCGLHAAQAQHGAHTAHGWPSAILGDIMASVMQLVHLPIGLQVGTFPGELTLA